MDKRPNELSYPARIRSLNRALVLEAIRRDGPTSRALLARSLPLAKPTVSGIVDDLVSEGRVRPAERTAAATRGRPPRLLAFNERSEFVLGVHVGVRHTTVALADATGAEIARRTLETPRLPAEALLGEVGAIARELVVTAAIPRRRLSAAGVCVPGQVDVEAGTCVHAPHLGWRDVPVVGLLGAAVGVPVHLHSVAQAAAIAEHVEGVGRGSRTMALVHAGTGVAAAILQDGRVFPGAAGMAGELGHAVVPGLDGPCPCGRHGCVETAASAPAVARAARDAIGAGSPTRLGALGDEVTALDVYAAAEARDTLAQALLGEAGRTLGIAASWLVNIVNPDVLVVGGGLVGAGVHVLDPFRAALEANTLPAVLDRMQVRQSSLGQDAGVRGALLLALQRTQGTYRLAFTERTA